MRVAAQVNPNVKSANEGVFALIYATHSKAKDDVICAMLTMLLEAGTPCYI